MLKKINKTMLVASAAFVAGLSSQNAHAGGGANTFDNVWANITTSIAGLPSLITVAAYIAGVVFAVLGVLKVKAPKVHLDPKRDCRFCRFHT